MIKIELSKYQVGLILEDLESEMYHICSNYHYSGGIWDSPEWEMEYNEREELVKVLKEELYKV